MIHIKSLKKYYDKKCILDIKDLFFEKGKKYAILGTNGSGKSTLFNLIIKDIKADEGKIEILDKIKIGYLPQVPYIFEFSVYKNLSMCINGLNRKEKKKIVENMLKDIELEKLANSKGNKLSGGEAQRLALARVLVQKNDVLILDEPTSATDILGIEIIERLLIEKIKKTNCTLIFSTHSPIQALRLADEVVFLQDGKIVEKGIAKEVLTKPETEYVKSFLKYWKM